jgi:putative transposase
MPYWRAFYHLIWTTKNREPLLIGQTEHLFVDAVRVLCERDGLMLHAFGVVPDHVHLALSIPPKYSIAEIVRLLKIYSNSRINESLGSGLSGPFAWQDEYGMFTFADNLYQTIVPYVRNQKRHHATNTLMPELELTDPRNSR